jgi:hypothetical protein
VIKILRKVIRETITRGVTATSPSMWPWAAPILSSTGGSSACISPSGGLTDRQASWEAAAQCQQGDGDWTWEAPTLEAGSCLIRMPGGFGFIVKLRGRCSLQERRRGAPRQGGNAKKNMARGGGREKM